MSGGPSARRRRHSLAFQHDGQHDETAPRASGRGSPGSLVSCICARRTRPLPWIEPTIPGALEKACGPRLRLALRRTPFAKGFQRLQCSLALRVVEVWEESLDYCGRFKVGCCPHPRQAGGPIRPASLTAPRFFNGAVEPLYGLRTRLPSLVRQGQRRA